MKYSSTPKTSESATETALETAIPDTKPPPEPGERAGVSGLQVIQSTLAAALGVQSSKNRERDFAQGRASQFIVAGILFTALFVGGMVLLVRTILSGS